MFQIAARQNSLKLRSDVQANRLLAVLPQDALERLLPDMDRVELIAGDVLGNLHGDLEYAYFPGNIILTVLVPVGDRSFTKVAFIGREGMVGIPALMGNAMPHRNTMALNAGEAFKIPIAALKAEFDRNGAVMRLLLRFAQSLITQMAQTAVCNRHHQVDQQLCCWLLDCMDRLPEGNSLPVTQKLIAGIFGVRREGISEAAGRLLELGLINYRRGHISMLDRPGLLANACECYQVVKRETDRLLPDRPAT